MTPIRKAYVHRDNIYGEIDGVKPGEWWETRMECSQAGVHRYVNFAVTINVYLIWSCLSYSLVNLVSSLLFFGCTKHMD